MPPSANVSSVNRMRLLRARRQRGLRCFTLEIRETEIAALVRKGLLRPENAGEPKAVREAIYLLLDRQLGGVA